MNQPEAPELLTINQAAALLQVPEKTLATWRSRGLGPRFSKLGGKHVRYPRTEIQRFIEAGLRQSSHGTARPAPFKG
ncbi:MAG: helix-turn-helix domain-containing protein [Candidatus Sumerlaeia bacterium]|nr:helix-turn-helix domain-containing protein [Candidatus Sumerlaeia bacterium]